MCVRTTIRTALLLVKGILQGCVVTLEAQPNWRKPKQKSNWSETWLLLQSSFRICLDKRNTLFDLPYWSPHHMYSNDWECSAGAFLGVTMNYVCRAAQNDLVKRSTNYPHLLYRFLNRAMHSCGCDVSQSKRPFAYSWLSLEYACTLHIAYTISAFNTTLCLALFRSCVRRVCSS